MSPRQFFGCSPTPLLPYLLMVASLLYSSPVKFFVVLTIDHSILMTLHGRKVLSSVFFCASFLELIHASFLSAGSWQERRLFNSEYPCCHATMLPRHHRHPPPANEISWYHASHESQSHLLYPVWVSTIKFIEL